MSEPPCVVVHGLPDARRALAAGLRLTLLSAPGAALFAGCGWWAAVVRQAEAESPGLVAGAWLDCADAPGRAMEALRAGARGLVLAPCPAWPSVAAICAAEGARLRSDRPEALDMAARGAERRLAAWLAGNVTPGRP